MFIAYSIQKERGWRLRVLQDQKIPLLETTKRNISVWLKVTAMAMTRNSQGKSNILLNFILYKLLSTGFSSNYIS